MSRYLDVIRGARKRLTPESVWIKECFATDGHDTRTGEVYEVDCNSDEATCWCMTGAFLAEMDFADEGEVLADPIGKHVYHKACKAICRFIFEDYVDTAQPHVTVQFWQDDRHRTHEEVLAMMDKVIAHEEGQAK